jgi:hypothetical protein
MYLTACNHRKSRTAKGAYTHTFRNISSVPSKVPLGPSRLSEAFASPLHSAPATSGVWPTAIPVA